MPQLDRRRSNPDPANLVSSRLREARRHRGLTQAEFSKLVQVEVLRFYPLFSYELDQSDMSRVEAGKRPVWDYELKAFAAVLGVSSDYLLGLVDDTGQLLGVDDDGH